MRYTKGAKQRGERYVWRCPAPEPMRFENCERFEELLRRTKNCAEAMGKMSTSVGLEVRVAAALLAGENSYANGVEHDHIANKIRRLLVRPVIEPSLISYWQYLSAANLDAERIAAYLQMVSGESVTKRPSPIWNCRFRNDGRIRKVGGKDQNRGSRPKAENCFADICLCANDNVPSIRGRKWQACSFDTPSITRCTLRFPLSNACSGSRVLHA